ncbi:tRNA (34-2'-O)-methyltransferase regulator WDR6 isoform X2 [Prorops nasuta]|uniref:tRNA (34-2'-O)-methyltransferase regulator WDR6 isoform X2 n=1 Tax=Prorops nasuta TaxID=863751 RepID=UPI0034CF382E
MYSQFNRYGGAILNNCINDCIILSGTVFQEILIWSIKPNKNDKDTSVPIMHRLLGHKGVIFSLNFDPENNLICSTSDDRTIRLWELRDLQNNHCSYCRKCVDWKSANIVLKTTMFGHLARVWRAVIKHKTIISIGEDSLICIWSLNGNILNKFQAHHGAAIWSIDVSEDKETILTGGANGSIYSWSLLSNNIPQLIPLSKDKHGTYPKYIGFLKSGNTLIFKEGGILLTYHIETGNFKSSNILQKYCKHCMMEISPSRFYVAFASGDGNITILAENTSKEHLEEILEERINNINIFSIQWLDNQTIIICCTNGILKILKISDKRTLDLQSEYILPTSRECWVTAAIIYENLLICSDRVGGMHVYKLYDLLNKRNDFETTDKIRKPIKSFSKVHGNIGIQSFAILHNKLMTTGRDGAVRFYEKQKDGSEETLLYLHALKMPMDWVSGTLKIEVDTLVVGFKEVEFIIYSISLQRILLRIPCGGGHRSWDCMLLNGFINFSYIRNKQNFLLRAHIKSLSLPVLMGGSHIKEICCMQEIRVNDKTFLVSGSEDCTLRITGISKENIKYYKTLAILDGHISSIRAISIIHLEEVDGYSKFFMISGGGRAQLKIWLLNISFTCTQMTSADISCIDKKSHMLYNTLKESRREESNKTKFDFVETRYMDIATCYSESKKYVFIFVACSDGFLRIFQYDIAKNNIYLKVSLNSGVCILKVHILQWFDTKILLTMDVFGIVSFWNASLILNNLLSNLGDSNERIETNDVKPLAIKKLHQSGINAFDIKRLNENNYLLSTGGDDNLLTISQLRISAETEKNPSINLSIQWSSPQVHSAQITGVKFIGDNQLLSVGVDQVVFLHRYLIDSVCQNVEKLSHIFTSISLVQGMTLLSNNESSVTEACVYGEGFEVISCSQQRLNNIL